MDLLGQPLRSPAPPGRRALSRMPRRPRGAGAPPAGRATAGRLARNVLLLLPVAVLLWLAITPFYNHLLVNAGERLIRLGESPDQTRIFLREGRYAMLVRGDVSGGQRHLAQLALADLHFNLILLVALFLAPPGVPQARRWSRLGWAALASLAFHLVLLIFHAEAVYALQLGEWSARHYGAVARNFWGLGKHVLDLPVKLGLPFLLWSAVYLPLVLPPHREPES